MGESLNLRALFVGFPREIFYSLNSKTLDEYTDEEMQSINLHSYHTR
jgi:hypothetical protein